MTRLLILSLLLFATASYAAKHEAPVHVVVVVGTPGNPTYEQVYRDAAQQWKEAAEKGGADFTLIGLDDLTAGLDDQTAGLDDRDRLKKAIEETSNSELWIALIGHGSYSNRIASFNINGPDFSAKDLAQWLSEYSGEIVVINSASASGTFVRELSGPNRIIITATKNPLEKYYTRFGKFFAEAINEGEGVDLNHDDQVSLLEAFLHSSSRTAQFYENAGRLSTEHPLLDDNGDRLGSRSEWFEGLTAIQTPTSEADPDGDLAAQKVLVPNEFERSLSTEHRKRRNDLERAIKQLRRQRETLTDPVYYEKLEPLLIELAHLYREIDKS